MKGYATSEGYMGLVQGRYMLFASEVDYREHMEDQIMKEQYITITGIKHYYGIIPFEIGRKITCVKEPDKNSSVMIQQQWFSEITFLQVTD